MLTTSYKIGVIKIGKKGLIYCSLMMKLIIIAEKLLGFIWLVIKLIMKSMHFLHTTTAMKLIEDNFSCILALRKNKTATRVILIIQCESTKNKRLALS